MKKTRVQFYYFNNDTMSTDSALALEKNNVQVFHQKIQEKENRSFLFNPVEILKNAIQFSPDYFIFLNSFGIDENCDLLKSLSILGIKNAAWFIDNPLYYVDWLRNMKKIKNLSLFVWDKFYLKYFANLGVSKIFYLPQATNPERFFPIDLSPKEKDIFCHPLTFAGNLDVNQLTSMMSKYIREYPEVEPDFTDIFQKLMILVVNNLSLPTWEIVFSFLRNNNYPKSIENERAVYILSRIIESKLSQMLRKEMVENLSEFDISIWGDKNEWRDYSNKANLLGRVSYFKNMPKVYNGTEINLNISRVQQRTGTNQRVFDVPACKSFLISDYREELEEMFDLGSELIVYKNFNELKKNVEYYQDPERRKTIINKGYEKVLANHTYSHRMVELIKTLDQLKVHEENIYDSENDQALLWIAKAYIECNMIKEAVYYLKILIRTSTRFYDETYSLIKKIQS